MPAIFSAIGRAAIAFGRKALTSAGGRLLGRRAALTAEQIAQAQAKRLADIKSARKSKALDIVRWILGSSERREEEPKTLAQREEAMVNHMSIWLAIGLTLFIIHSFFTNVLSNAPIPSGAL